MRYTLNVLTAIITLTASVSAKDVTNPPSLPQAFSSFGGCVCDGYVYVYGGHTGKTHTYSTESVTGKFRRFNLADPAKGWEELPVGPGL